MKKIIPLYIVLFFCFLPHYAEWSIERDIKNSTLLIENEGFNPVIYVKKHIGNSYFQLLFENEQITPIPFFYKIIKEENREIARNLGSGLIITKNNKDYILTNYHVCQSDLRSQATYVYAKYAEKMYYSQKDIIFDKVLDLCLIPYKGKNPPFNIVNFNWRKKILLLYNVQIKYYNFKRHDFDHTTLYIENVLKEELNKESFEIINHPLYDVLTPSVLINVKVVKGDSGSPIISNHGELYSIVYGNIIDSENYNKAISRKEKEKYVTNGISVPSMYLKMFLDTI